MMQKIVGWTPCQYRWTKVLDSYRDKPTIRYEIEKKKYTGVVYAKGPLMIMLEWNSIGAYCKRIQLGNNFWGENCLPPSFGLCGFYSSCINCLNEYLHLWDMKSLVLMAGFYCLPMANRPLVPIWYSLISCLGHWMSFISFFLVSFSNWHLDDSTCQKQDLCSWQM